MKRWKLHYKHARILNGCLQVTPKTVMNWTNMLCLKEKKQFYCLNSSVSLWPVLIIFGMQHQHQT